MELGSANGFLTGCSLAVICTSEKITRTTQFVDCFTGLFRICVATDSQRRSAKLLPCGYILRSSDSLPPCTGVTHFKFFVHFLSVPKCLKRLGQPRMEVSQRRISRQSLTHDGDSILVSSDAHQGRSIIAA